MPKAYLEQVCRPEQSVNRLFNHLGVEVVAIGPDCARLRMRIKPELIQGAGLVGGGILATLLDEAMAHSVLAGNAPCEQTTTVDMTVSYLRPVNDGAQLLCEARVIKRGRRVVFAQAVIRREDEPGEPETARATATFLTV